MKRKNKKKLRGGMGPQSISGLPKNIPELSSHSVVLDTDSPVVGKELINIGQLRLNADVDSRTQKLKGSADKIKHTKKRFGSSGLVGGSLIGVLGVGSLSVKVGGGKFGGKSGWDYCFNDCYC